MQGPIPTPAVRGPGQVRRPRPTLARGISYAQSRSGNSPWGQEKKLSEVSLRPCRGTHRRSTYASARMSFLSLCQERKSANSEVGEGVSPRTPVPPDSLSAAGRWGYACRGTVTSRGYSPAPRSASRDFTLGNSHLPLVDRFRGYHRRPGVDAPVDHTGPCATRRAATGRSPRPVRPHAGCELPNRVTVVGEQRSLG